MRCLLMVVAAVSLTTGQTPNSHADQIRTTQVQPEASVDWSQVRGAVALSTTRHTGGKTTTFLSTAVMIGPTIGLTSAHGLDRVSDAAIIDDMVVRPQSKRIKISAKAIHPDYR